MDQQTHNEACGQVGETGAHGDLGTNDATAAPAAEQKQEDKEEAKPFGR